jgi:ankyrin repeat protein
METNQEKKFISSAQNDDFQTVKMLLKNIDFDINEKDIYGRTALQYAIKYFSHEENTSKEEKLTIIKFLIENGADIYSRDGYGETALSYAIKYDHFDIVELLFKHKAYLGPKDHNRFSPLESALAFTKSDSRIGFFIRENKNVAQNVLNEYLEKESKFYPGCSS